jgi:hypothetical protein
MLVGNQNREMFLRRFPSNESSDGESSVATAKGGCTSQELEKLRSDFARPVGGTGEAELLSWQADLDAKG